MTDEKKPRRHISSSPQRAAAFGATAALTQHQSYFSARRAAILALRFCTSFGYVK